MMSENPLESLSSYSQFVANVLDRSAVERSTVTVWSDSPYTGIVEGEIFFSNGIRLRLREELDFDANLITSYGYEMYRGCIGMMTFRIPMIRLWHQPSLITSTYRLISNATAFLHRR
jgi:hypothetical protein